MADRSSSDSSDCHIVREQNSKSSSSSSVVPPVPYNVTISTSPEPELSLRRSSSSSVHDEELTGSYSVGSTPGGDFNVRIKPNSRVFSRLTGADLGFYKGGCTIHLKEYRRHRRKLL